MAWTLLTPMHINLGTISLWLMLMLVIAYNHHLPPSFENSNSPNIDLTSFLTFVYLYFLLMLSLTSLHNYHHVMLFALSTCLIFLFLHQLIVFFYPCRLKTQSKFICLSLPFALRFLPFTFKCVSTFIAFFLLDGLFPLPFIVVFLASGTQIH